MTELQTALATNKVDYALSDPQRLAWLRLIRSENVGPRTFRDLLNYYGSAETALAHLPELSAKGGKTSYRLCSSQEAEQELTALENKGARLIALGEPGYPAPLRHIDSPPPLLSVLGADLGSTQNYIAIVGARNCSAAGAKLTKTFAKSLGAQGHVVVSGLARGIDSAAHQASLQTGTAAVFAGGLDVLYPPQNARLAEEILAHNGALLTEMPLGHVPRAHDFPRRNRIVSGMSRALIVIEAAAKSGSLHTARFALEQNREIFAVPGSPLDPRSEGANQLLKQGAHMALCPQDILDELASPSLRQPQLAEEPEHKQLIAEETRHTELAQNKAPPPVTQEDIAQLHAALTTVPTSMDDLAAHTGIAVTRIPLALLHLQLAGKLQRHHMETYTSMDP